MAKEVHEVHEMWEHCCCERCKAYRARIGHPPMVGVVDEVAAFGTQLTASEIQALRCVPGRTLVGKPPPIIESRVHLRELIGHQWSTIVVYDEILQENMEFFEMVAADTNVPRTYRAVALAQAAKIRRTL